MRNVIASLFTTVSVLIFAAPATAVDSSPSSETVLDALDGNAGARAEQRSSGSGSSTGDAESAADRWNRRCSRAGIGVYNPDEAGSFTSARERVGDAVGTITEAYYTEYATAASPGGLTVEVLDTIAVPEVGGYGYYRTTCVAGTRTSVVGQVLFDGTETSPWEIRNLAEALLKIPAPQPHAAPSLTESYSIVKIPTWFWNTYTKSTAGLPNDALTITTTITWELSWTLNGINQGTFETFQNTTNTSHQVGEIQTYIVPNQ